MADRANLRVSDADRERAARELRDHFAAGRLTEEELNERLSAVLAARTEAELGELRADLPLLPATRAEVKAELDQRRAELRRRLIQQSGGGLGLVALCVGIWVSDGATGQFWPVWVLIVVLLPLLRGGWRLYGPAPDLERVERELARRAGHRRHRDRRRHR